MRVVVASGTYMMSTPFLLTPQDSGTERFGVVYEAAPGARPVFTGGKAITGFQPDADGVWKTHIPEAASGSWYFEQLFVNGRRACAGSQSEQVLLLHDGRPGGGTRQECRAKAGPRPSDGDGPT